MRKDKKIRGIVNKNNAPIKPVFKCPCGYTTGDIRKIMEHEKVCKLGR